MKIKMKRLMNIDKQQLNDQIKSQQGIRNIFRQGHPKKQPGSK